MRRWPYNAPVLAAAPITWGVCELPGWGEELPYRRVLDEMAAAGFQGTELGRDGYLPSDPARLRQELAPRGLSLVGAFCPLTLHRPEEAGQSVQRAATLARRLADLGCRTLITADAGSDRRRATAGRVPRGDTLPPDAWRRIGDGLAEIAGDAAGLGVRLVFHPHAGTHVETPDEVAALMDVAPAGLVGLCLDTGHLMYGGGDPVALCRQYAGRIWHVHAKDVRGAVLARVRGEGLDYYTAVGEGVFAPLGEGTVDFPSIIDTLQRAAYDGWYVLEQDVRLGPPWPAQDPLANARRSAAYLRRLLKE